MKELFDRVVNAWHEWREVKGELECKRRENWADGYNAILPLAKHYLKLLESAGGELSEKLGLAVGQTVAIPGKEWVVILSPLSDGEGVRAKVKVFPAMWVKGGKSE